MADNVTTEDLDTAIQNLAESMGISTKEYVEGGFLDLTTYGTDKTAIEALIAANTEAMRIATEQDDDGVQSWAEKIVAINAVLSDAENGELQNILDKINVNTSAIAGLVTTTDVIRTDLDLATAKGNTNATGISDLNTALTSVSGRVTTTEGALTTLNSDATVAGSVAKAVKGEEDRAKASMQTTLTEVARVEAERVKNTDAITILNSDDTVDGSVAKAVLDATGGDITDLKGRVEDEEKESARVAGILDDTTDVDDNLVKGVVTKVGDNAQAIINALADAKAYTDANTLKAASMDICAAGNKFRSALGLADATCGTDGDGEAL